MPNMSNIFAGRLKLVHSCLTIAWQTSGLIKIIGIKTLAKYQFVVSPQVRSKVIKSYGKCKQYNKQNATRVEQRIDQVPCHRARHRVQTACTRDTTKGTNCRVIRTHGPMNSLGLSFLRKFP